MVHVLLDPNRRPSKNRPSGTVRHIWVRGPQLPGFGEGEEDFLTPKDNAAIVLEHIERTSDVVFKLEIRKRG